METLNLDATESNPVFDLTRTTTPSSESARVLLVEDNKVNQMFAQEVFKEAGYSYITCENGQLAIDYLLQDDLFDIVLMDCHMPVKDGFAATTEIRELIVEGKIRQLPIVALTANALSGDREKCLNSGMDEYMTKPYGVNELINVVNRLSVIPASFPSVNLPTTASDLSTGTQP